MSLDNWEGLKTVAFLLLKAVYVHDCSKGRLRLSVAGGDCVNSLFESDMNTMYFGVFLKEKTG